MLRVRLAWTGTQAATLHAPWRATVALAPPALPGLRARQWQLDSTSVQGCYLFDDEHDIASFLANPAADPAYAQLAAHASAALAEPPRIDRVPSEAKVERPVFIIAAPRSGSTLLFDLLAQAPGLWTQGGEGQGAVDGIAALHLAQRGYVSDRLTDADFNADIETYLHAGWHFALGDRHGRRYEELSDAGRLRAPRLLDKTTEHTLRVSFLARACPDARFVLLHRDARQNVSSLMQAWRHGGFVRLHNLPDWPERDWCFLLPPEWRALRGRSLQELATAQWEAACQWALHDLKALDRTRWTSVDYNDLVAHPRYVIERLCAFLDVEFDAHLAAHLAKPIAVSATAISPPSAIKWRSHRELDVPLLEAATRSTSACLRTLHSLPSGAANATSSPTPTQSAVRFACPLQDVLLDEPGPSEIGDELDLDPLMVEPTLRFQLGASIPLGLATSTRFRERFLPDQPILWTRNLLTKAYQPYWVPCHQARLFTEFEPGALAPPCPPPLRSQLLAAGIVASATERGAAARRAEDTRVRLTSEFAERSYCVVPGIFAAPHTAALARYYRELIASGRWALGDAQVAQRHGWHNESMARFFHHQLTGFVGAIVGEPVCASYTYVSAYKQGAELEPHVDRKQCEYTLSVIIDETGGRSVDWPLWFLAGTERSAVTLDIGEGVLFRGHDLPHWREAAPQPGLSLSTLLLHYVPTSFQETLY